MTVEQLAGLVIPLPRFFSYLITGGPLGLLVLTYLKGPVGHISSNHGTGGWVLLFPFSSS